jgi:hypothetical protein
MEVTADNLGQILKDKIEGKPLSQSPAKELYAKAVQIGLVKKETREYTRNSVQNLLFS